jgi:hypothetical protein
VRQRPGRRKRLTLTPLGTDLLRQGHEIFNELRTRFQRQIGRKELLALEAHLAVLVGDKVEQPGGCPYVDYAVGGEAGAEQLIERDVEDGEDRDAK